MYYQVNPVEVACERLRAKHLTRLKSKEAAADLELYVPPLCSPSKDTPDGDDGIKDLNDAVTSWLESDSHQVLLLHGQSGSGKSLYVTTLSLLRFFRIWTVLSCRCDRMLTGTQSALAWTDTVLCWSSGCGGRTVAARRPTHHY